MTVAYGGHPGETAALREVAERHGVALLEDAAHAAGSRVDGRHLGTFGTVGAFSFFSNKNLAVGEGGMVVTDDDEVAARLRLLRSHGMTTLTWDRHRGHASGYDVVALGYNYRLDEPRAALALSRLARLESENEQRRAHAARYREAFRGCASLRRRPPSAQPTRSRRSTSSRSSSTRMSTATRSAPRSPSRASRRASTIRRCTRFRSTADRAPDLPVTSSYGARTVTLPLFAHMTDEQVDLVADAVLRAAWILASTPALVSTTGVAGCSSTGRPDAQRREADRPRFSWSVGGRGPGVTPTRRQHLRAMAGRRGVTGPSCARTTSARNRCRLRIQ